MTFFLFDGFIPNPTRMLLVYRIFFSQLLRNGNLHGSGMSQTRSASPRAPWRTRDAVVGRGNAGWTLSKNGDPCTCQNCSQKPPAEKTGRRSLLNRPSCLPDDTGDWTELNWFRIHHSFVLLLSFNLWVNHGGHAAGGNVVMGGGLIV